MNARLEQERLAALRAFRALDSAPEPIFDNLTELAAWSCEAPTALVSLVDEWRQWFKARVGLDASETPREVAFCDHAVRQDDVMVVEDAALDDRFRGNPLVTGVPHIRFYAGALLRTRDGHMLGTLCVIDYRPRTLTAAQRAALVMLARQVMTLLEFRKVSLEMADVLDELAELRRLVPVCAWCRNIRDDEGFWHRVDRYIEHHTMHEVTHGICPSCAAAVKNGGEKEPHTADCTQSKQ
ncbi:GAF domain-containing protein [Caenispirillum salinarum]|uniref:GAF domain-containing protein n=1 Tax=Caenispirillum salinarum TaxID=859058 RepID=UPI00384C58EA